MTGCYFQEDDPSDMKMRKYHGKNEPDLFLGFFIVFIILALCVMAPATYLIFFSD